MSPMKIDHEAIRGLAELLNETDLTEIEISEGDKSIRVSRNSHLQAAVSAPMFANVPAQAPVAAPVAAAPAAVSFDNHPGAVKSPMVGTVYFKSEPGAKEYVSKGSSVKVGDILIIVEAMKVMNPIKADKAGIVKEILVEDAQPVEYGQPLLIIE